MSTHNWKDDFSFDQDDLWPFEYELCVGLFWKYFVDWINYDIMEEVDWGEEVVEGA